MVLFCVGTLLSIVFSSIFVSIGTLLFAIAGSFLSVMSPSFDIRDLLSLVFLLVGASNLLSLITDKASPSIGSTPLSIPSILFYRLYYSMSSLLAPSSLFVIIF